YLRRSFKVLNCQRTSRMKLSQKPVFHPTIGREAKTATFIRRCPSNFMLRGFGFAPRQFNRSTASTHSPKYKFMTNENAKNMSIIEIKNLSGQVLLRLDGEQIINLMGQQLGQATGNKLLNLRIMFFTT
ncbi:MAG: hypothetical protein WKF90_12940, partial [Pyrinomonadaceae bacterium]